MYLPDIQIHTEFVTSAHSFLARKILPLFSHTSQSGKETSVGKCEVEKVKWQK